MQDDRDGICFLGHLQPASLPIKKIRLGTDVCSPISATHPERHSTKTIILSLHFDLQEKTTMTIKQIIDDKSVKRLEKRKLIVEGIVNGSLDFSAVSAACSLLPEKNISLLLEAIEEVSRSKEVSLGEDYLTLAERYILSSDPSCKREASRIVGNLAAAFPAKLDRVITALLQNAHQDGTVIRWASAYALSRIVIIPQYARGTLFEQVTKLYEQETENGVKNQYGKALKKAEKIR